LFVGKTFCFFNKIFLDDVCYIANVGDSRALLSLDGGNFIGMLSTDHKPNDDAEQKRITEAGGKIYQ
jgi:protein phosphatase PTC2/3